MLLLKNLLFTLLVPTTVAVYLPWRIANRSLDALTWPWPLTSFAALFSLLAGAALFFWCLWNFAVIGRGTPAPSDPPQRLVARGPYRLVRNPMYLAALLTIAGWSLFWLSWRVAAYGALLSLLFHCFVVFFEEPGLRRRFGEDYASYCRRANRWLPGHAAADARTLPKDSGENRR